MYTPVDGGSLEITGTVPLNKFTSLQTTMKHVLSVLEYFQPYFDLEPKFVKDTVTDFISLNIRNAKPNKYENILFNESKTVLKFRLIRL